MNKIRITRLSKILILGFTALCCLNLGFIVFFNGSFPTNDTRLEKALADGALGGWGQASVASKNPYLLLPTTEIEYQKLNSPDYIAVGEKYVAITDNNVISVYDKVSCVKIATFSSGYPIGQIKTLNRDEFLVVHNYVVCRMFLVDNAIKIEELKTNDEWNIPVGGIIDYNGRELFINTNGTARTFSVTENAISQTSVGTAVLNESPVAINSDSIFYVDLSRNFQKKNTANNLVAEIASNVNPQSMIANDEYVYYIENKKIYRINLENNEKSELTFNCSSFMENGEYDIGTCNFPNSLAFSGDNLLITDKALGAITEFKVVGNELLFTGFAIASGKSAYNRISSTATDIEKFGELVVVLDSKKLTVITNTKDFDGYSPKFFVNHLIGQAPERFALGNGTILYSRDNTVWLLDNIMQKRTDYSSLDSFVAKYEVTDICYQSGYYYVLSSSPNKCVVYRFAENNVTEPIEKKEYGFPSVSFTVNANKNVCMLQKTGAGLKILIDGVVKKHGNDEIVFPGSESDKIYTDLAGDFFRVSNGKIQALIGEDWMPLTLTDSELDAVDGSSSNVVNGLYIKSFCISYDNSEAFYLAKNSEYVFKATKLRYGTSSSSKFNLSISAIEVPSELFNKNVSVFKDVEKMQFYNVNNQVEIDDDGKEVIKDYNIYSVDVGRRFTYKYLSMPIEEYVYVGLIRIPTLSNNVCRMIVLASQNGFALINNQDAKTHSKEYTVSTLEKAFITTDVCLYHLPVITENDMFVSEFNGNPLRIRKGTQITPINEFSYLGKDYFSASVVVDGATVKAFIPVSFTVDILSDNVQPEAYSIRNTISTKVYKNIELTEELSTIADNTVVKVYSTENGVCRISYKSNENDIFGYVSIASIKRDSDISMRNILIVLCVVASVCGALSYFLLRKKVVKKKE